MKRFFSLLLVMVMLFVSLVTVSAYDEIDSTESLCTIKEIENLDKLCRDAVLGFGISGNEYYLCPGGYKPLIAENYHDVVFALRDAEKVVVSTGFCDDNFNPAYVTSEQVDTVYNNLKNAMDAGVVSGYEVQRLVDYCSKETNSNNYYPSDLYEDFTESLEATKSALDNDATVEEIDSAFWELYYNFSRLCIVNTKLFDIDFSSEVNIMDATRYQQILAKIHPMNSSIKFIESNKFCATDIQRYLVGMQSLPNGASLNKLSENIEKMDKDSNCWEYVAWRYNELYCTDVVSIW